MPDELADPLRKATDRLGNCIGRQWCGKQIALGMQGRVTQEGHDLLGPLYALCRDGQSKSLAERNAGARDCRRPRAAVDGGNQTAIELDAGQWQQIQ